MEKYDKKESELGETLSEENSRRKSEFKHKANISTGNFRYDKDKEVKATHTFDTGIELIDAATNEEIKINTSMATLAFAPEIELVKFTVTAINQSLDTLDKKIGDTTLTREKTLLEKLLAEIRHATEYDNGDPDADKVDNKFNHGTSDEIFDSQNHDFNRKLKEALTAKSEDDEKDETDPTKLKPKKTEALAQLIAEAEKCCREKKVDIVRRNDEMDKNCAALKLGLRGTVENGGGLLKKINGAIQTIQTQLGNTDKSKTMPAAKHKHTDLRKIWDAETTGLIHLLPQDWPSYKIDFDGDALADTIRKTLVLDRLIEVRIKIEEEQTKVKEKFITLPVPEGDDKNDRVWAPTLATFAAENSDGITLLEDTELLLGSLGGSLSALLAESVREQRREMVKRQTSYVSKAKASLSKYSGETSAALDGITNLIGQFKVKRENSRTENLEESQEFDVLLKATTERVARKMKTRTV